VEDLVRKMNKQLWATGLRLFAEERHRRQDPLGSGSQETEEDSTGSSNSASLSVEKITGAG
jgi:hypothetical protein